MVETIITKVSHQGDGTTKVFPFSFALASSSDVHVAIYDTETNESKTLTSDYYVDTNAKTVTYPGYASGQEPAASAQPAVLTSKQTITIYRETEIDQTTDLGSKYPLTNIEAMVDKLTLIAQEHDEEIGRSVKVAVGDSETPEERYLEMQTYVKDTADAAMTAENAASDADDYAQAAAASATEAATSATKSATSEKNAASSATSSSNDAEYAARQASNAARSASAAASSNTSAMQYMQQAAKSSQSAAGAAAIASSKSEEAKEAARRAAASESGAASSAATASSYAATALSYKNDAAASATSASSYATAANEAAVKSQTASANSQIAEKWAVSTDSPDGGNDSSSPTEKTQSSRTWALYAKEQAQSAALVALNVQSIINDAVEVLRNSLNTENRAYIDLGETELQVVQVEAEDGTTYATNTVVVSATEPGTSAADVWIDIS